MHIRYDSFSPCHKTPFGCVQKREPCHMEIWVPKTCPTTGVYLVLNNHTEGETLRLLYTHLYEQDTHRVFVFRFSLKKTGLYLYHFEVEEAHTSFRLFRKGLHDTHLEEGDFWQLTCYEDHFDTPIDAKGGVMYQIFPDRFHRVGSCDLTDKLTPFLLHADTADCPMFLPDATGEIQNHDFFGGNLKGIEEKLPYLKQLGITWLYLNPIHMAYSNHRYDVADYKRVDPMLGTTADFVSLCNTAHGLGIHILLDGVFSHTGSDSIYFDKKLRFGNGACSNPHSPYRSWYHFEEYPTRYESWWGVPTLPAVDEMNPYFLDYIIRNEDSVVAHWLNLGADGFRLDVADELPDPFIRMLRDKVKEIKPDGLVVGEVWEDASNKISYGKRKTYFSNSELDAVMNYPFRSAILDFVSGADGGRHFYTTVMTIAENYPKPVLDCLMNSLSTHDTPRAITLLGDPFEGTKEEKASRTMTPTQKEEAEKALRMAAFLQFTLPGMPCIYYGDEIGMEGYEDPLNRRYYPWNNPGEDLFFFFAALSRLKQSHPALRYGDIQFEKAEKGQLIFSRRFEQETITVYVNNSHSLEIKGENNLFLYGGYVSNGIIFLSKLGFCCIKH